MHSRVFSLSADDTTVFEPTPSFDFPSIRGTIGNIDIRMKRNRQKCYLDKSKVNVFAKNVPEVIKFGYLGITIKTNRYLEVDLDEKFSFKDHVQKLQRTISFCKYLILRTGSFPTRSLLMTFHKTRVKPTIQYGVLIYGCTTFSNLHNIRKWKKRIARSISFLPKYSSVSQFMIDNEVATVYELHIYDMSSNSF